MYWHLATCEAGEVRVQIGRADLVGEDVLLVEEEDDGGAEEPG